MPNACISFGLILEVNTPNDSSVSSESVSPCVQHLRKLRATSLLTLSIAAIPNLSFISLKFALSIWINACDTLPCLASFAADSAMR